MAGVVETRPPQDFTTSPSAEDEFNDAEYCKDVLHLDPATTELDVDAALEKQASALGIALTTSALGDARDVPNETVDTEREMEHARTESSCSQETTSTGITSPRASNDNTTTNSLNNPKSGIRRSLSFSEYDRFLARAHIPTTREAPAMVSNGPSLFSAATKKSMTSFRNGIRRRILSRKEKAAEAVESSCVCCRDDFKKAKTLRTLPCSHKYCNKCLRILVQQALMEELKMPPKCCGIALSTPLLKSIMTHDEQSVFMKGIQHYATPWEERVYCPKPSCNEFISRPRQVDPKRPFQLVCRECGTKICSICKHDAHGAGQDCPLDWELDVVLRMGKAKGWKRCYKCRNLVELSQGCSHITCRCKAQFCYICGAIWDPTIGCPNYCTGEEELERRRLEDEARVTLEAIKQAENEAAVIALARDSRPARKRTEESQEHDHLRNCQQKELDRFCAFEDRMRWRMWQRLGQLRTELLDRFAELEADMQARHAKCIIQLEDQQVVAEMELRTCQKQDERVVRGRIRHMEAYCHGVGARSTAGSDTSGRSSLASENPRVVTERDLRELGLQYSIRDDMERLHQSRINVMREKQAKQMETLFALHEEEMASLAQNKDVEIGRLRDYCAADEDKFTSLFKQRKARLIRRWRLDSEVMRKSLEATHRVPFAPLADLEWPAISRRADALSAVME